MRPTAPGARRRLSFSLPARLEAGSPSEARGSSRDAVRLMVAYRSDSILIHSRFSEFDTYLDSDDLVVINTSATLPAALRGVDPSGGTEIIVHLSTNIRGSLWVVEPRRPSGRTSERWPLDGKQPPGKIVFGEDGSYLTLLRPYMGSTRLWVGELRVPGTVLAWLAAHGSPIRYGYASDAWPLSAYQNVYARQPGSAEMPSAGRPFTPEIITRLVAKGVGVTPVVLHAGVASLEADELPFPERAMVPSATARRVNDTLHSGGQVVAVGTTVVRALESAYDSRAGLVTPYDGWTDLVVTPERGTRVVSGLLTGWHEPEASHLLMLEAIAGRELIEKSYAASLAEGYLWHEFGDVHLILP